MRPNLPDHSLITTKETLMTKMDTALLDTAAAAAVQATNKARRKRLFAVLGATILTGATGYGGYVYFYASRFVSTDNAYTAAETAQVTPAVSGIVSDVRVADTQQVRTGDVLVVLDDVDTRLALAQADADLSRAVRRVRGYVANDRSLAAQLAARISEEQRADAQLASAHADLDRAKVDLDRREALAASGSVSGDELTRARNAFATAGANVSAAAAASAQARANYTATA